MGFFRLFTPEEDYDLERVDGLGEPWEVLEPGLAVKRYPCCYAAHRAADAVITLAERHDLAPEQVQEIVVHVGPGGIEPDGYVGPMRYPRPTNGMLVAMTVRNRILAPGGRFAMCSTARATWATSKVGSTSMVPLACRRPCFALAAISVSALPMSI